MQSKCILLKEAANKVGLDFIVTCTARTFKEQVALYAQGRQLLEETNKLRKIANLPVITAIENKKKITWTLASEHIVNLDDKDITNDKARAFDIALVKPGTREIFWNVKVNVNKNDVPDYMELAKIGREIGLTCGAFWGTPDFPHYQ